MSSVTSKGYFVTGTDTEIGKTRVSQLLIQFLVSKGTKVAAMKPVASGAKYVDGQLKNEDALCLQQVANIEQSYADVNPYVFEPAIAPHIAAQQAGVNIDLDVIVECARKLQARSDKLVVEGVGGWKVPLNKTQLVTDLALKLELPVLIVVGMKLGCINHALLTYESIERSGAKIAGWVANQPTSEKMSCLEDNLDFLQQALPVPLVASIQYIEPGSSYHPGFSLD